MTGEGARHWIDKNLWAILAVGLGLYTGYLTGMTTVQNEVETLKRDVARLERVVEDLHPRR